jgi:hypothetical protein
MMLDFLIDIRKQGRAVPLKAGSFVLGASDAALVALRTSAEDLAVSGA